MLSDLNRDHDLSTSTILADFSGQIIPLDMGRYGNHVVCQKSSLLASSVSVSVSVEFSGSLGAGFFGGEGCKFYVSVREDL
jgi:uncharacterized protein (AIM24 family)